MTRNLLSIMILNFRWSAGIWRIFFIFFLVSLLERGEILNSYAPTKNVKHYKSDNKCNKKDIIETTTYLSDAILETQNPPGRQLGRAPSQNGHPIDDHWVETHESRTVILLWNGRKNRRPFEFLEVYRSRIDQTYLIRPLSHFTLTQPWR